MKINEVDVDVDARLDRGLFDIRHRIKSAEWWVRKHRKPHNGFHSINIRKKTHPSSTHHLD
jgi:hypothetical protein